MEDEPVQVALPVEKITPYEYGIYCTIDGSKPFVNEIVSRSWRDDGSVSLMLETFNFHRLNAGETCEVVHLGKPQRPCEGLARKCQCDSCFEASKPKPLNADDQYLVYQLSRRSPEERHRIMEMAREKGAG